MKTILNITEPYPNQTKLLSASRPPTETAPTLLRSNPKLDLSLTSHLFAVSPHLTLPILFVVRSIESMATPAQTQTPINIKSAARKLPIKRKPQPQPQAPPDPSPAPNPNPSPSPITPDPYADPYDEYDFDDEEEEEEEEASDRHQPEVKPPPPFKFHRIWSESDEIRFLQGLLGCWSQGLVFPRDLNIFYDRFSESMPQPYTRSQLSEKLRRLRKKFRVVSGRIARGQDPTRLAPHDRDLLHLCTRLWDPKHAATSPFSAADAAASGSGSSGNKRRRPNPRAPSLPATAVAGERSLDAELEKEEDGGVTVAEEKPVPVSLPAPAPVPAPVPVPLALALPVPDKVGVVGSVGEAEGVGFGVAKIVLDVFDGALKEVRMALEGDGRSENGLARRWEELRVAELDVFARRLRLVLEQSLHN